jgi:hypothetical protein
MTYLGLAVRCLLATAFVVICLVQAKRIGVAGAILLSVVAVLDESIVVGWFALGHVHVNAVFTALDVLNVLFNLASTPCVVVAMISLRPRSSVPG